MKVHNFNPIYLFTAACAALIFATGCNVTDSDNDNKISPPDTYEFTRNNESSVAYPGQTARLNMVAEMKSYVAQANDGQLLSQQDLIDMFENKNNNGGGNFSFTSEKQLKNKTFAPDLDDNLFTGIFQSAELASENGNQGVRASNGVAGLLERESKGSDILVDEKGREFTQLIEKGLMGAVFFNQIYNVYLTDNRIGPNVENDQLEEGKNYTAKEHHFDEAFGYFGAPVDFSSPWPDAREDEARFWAHYADVSDDELGFIETLMDAYILGRTAIVNKDQEELNNQREILYEQLELLAAATSVHYINNTISALNNTQTGEAFHALSEAWAFVNALKYSPQRKLTLNEVDQILNSNFGSNGNFWNVTIDGLNTAKSKLVSTWPTLDPVKNVL